MPEVEDETKGYRSGEDCPKFNCDGIIEIRRTTTGKRNSDGLYEVHSEYAQCCRCSWNSMR